jgi:hypothetical protein
MLLVVSIAKGFEVANVEITANLSLRLRQLAAWGKAADTRANE